MIEKDAKKLITVVNTLLADYHARVAIYEMPSSILMFFEANAEQVNGDVVIVRDTNDEGGQPRKEMSVQRCFLFSVRIIVSLVIFQVYASKSFCLKR